MWRSAFVGLLVAVVVIGLWRSARGAEPPDEQRIGWLETRVADLEAGQPPIAPASIVVQGAFIQFQAPYQWYQYCKIGQYGPNAANVYELVCMEIDPNS